MHPITFYYAVFRWLPKSAFSRLMGRFASCRWPGWLLRPVIRVYVWVYGIDLSEFTLPVQAYRTFNEFFTRPVRSDRRPVADDPRLLVSPVDGTVIEGGTMINGRLVQAKGQDYSLEALLDGDPAWRDYAGGAFITLYLSPRDYHRIHMPCAGRIIRFRYVPGELWTVGPAGVRGVPNLFARNERLVTFIRAEFGELAVVAVGATVVGKIRVVYHSIVSNLRDAHPAAEALPEPLYLPKGAEMGRFELGSTVILLTRPGEAGFYPLKAGAPVRMGAPIGQIG
jgi:phosphatidylserine decarboxylase